MYAIHLIFYCHSWLSIHPLCGQFHVATTHRYYSHNLVVLSANTLSIVAARSLTGVETDKMGACSILDPLPLVLRLHWWTGTCSSRSSSESLYNTGHFNLLITVLFGCNCLQATVACAGVHKLGHSTDHLLETQMYRMLFASFFINSPFWHKSAVALYMLESENCSKNKIQITLFPGACYFDAYILCS